MGMNDIPSGERVHIGFFGRRNAGKSSLVNAVTGQELSVVSEQKGTTTDPVFKAMELLPLGAVMIIDTPGFDDSGSLGELRVKKTRAILNKTDIAVLTVDSAEGMTGVEEELLEIFREKNIPYIIAWNKQDISGNKTVPEHGISVSAADGSGVWQLKEALGKAEKIRGKTYLRRLDKKGRYSGSGNSHRRCRSKRETYSSSAADYS